MQMKLEIKGEIMTDRLNMNDSQKAKHLIKNHKEYKLSWDDIAKITNIPKSTLTGLKSYPKRLKTARWELISALAELDDKMYIKAKFGSNSDLMEIAMKSVIDQHIPGNDEVSQVIKKIVKHNPTNLVDIANALEKEKKKGMRRSEKGS